MVTFDAIMPASMAVRAEQSGVKRANTDPVTVLAAERARRRLHFVRRNFRNDRHGRRWACLMVSRVCSRGSVFCAGLSW